jgi:hypothetical protein
MTNTTTNTTETGNAAVAVAAAKKTKKTTTKKLVATNKKPAAKKTAAAKPETKKTAKSAAKNTPKAVDTGAQHDVHAVAFYTATDKLAVGSKKIAAEVAGKKTAPTTKYTAAQLAKMETALAMIATGDIRSMRDGKLKLSDLGINEETAAAALTAAGYAVPEKKIRTTSVVKERMAERATKKSTPRNHAERLPKPGSKQRKIYEMLLRKNGATAAEICEATGWKNPHIQMVEARCGIKTRTMTDKKTGNLRYFADPVE